MSEARLSFLEIVLPVVEYQDQKRRALEPPPRPRRLSGKTIAALPNFKTISPPFMSALAARLGTETDAGRAYMHNPDWQFTHP